MNFIVVELDYLKMPSGFIDLKKYIENLAKDNSVIEIVQRKSDDKWRDALNNNGNFESLFGKLRFENLMKSSRLYYIYYPDNIERKVGELNAYFPKQEIKKVLDDYYAKNTMLASNVAVQYSMAIWLLKDSAVSPQKMYMYSKANGYNVSIKREVTYTNSRCENETVKISKNELDTIEKYFQLLNPYLLDINNNPNGPGLIQYNEISHTIIVDKVQSQYQKSFTRTLQYIQEARCCGQLTSKIDNYINAIQCIFAVKKDFTKNCSEITAALISNKEDERIKIVENISSAYSIRSDYSHGQSAKYTRREMEEISHLLDKYLRKILKLVLIDPSLNYSNTIDDKARVRAHFLAESRSIYN